MENSLILFLTYLVKLLSLFTLCSLNGLGYFTVIMSGQKSANYDSLFLSVIGHHDHYKVIILVNEIIRITFLVWWTWF